MNNSSQSSLLTQKRFLPYFITQFLGAFNDNIFKNVLVTIETNEVAHRIGKLHVSDSSREPRRYRPYGRRGSD